MTHGSSVVGFDGKDVEVKDKMVNWDLVLASKILLRTGQKGLEINMGEIIKEGKGKESAWLQKKRKNKG
jgi:hypothetical protein